MHNYISLKSNYSLYRTTMMNEKVVDSQPLQGDLHRTTDMHTNK